MKARFEHDSGSRARFKHDQERDSSMIKRYSRPEMSAIWSDRNRYRIWLEVEEAVCEELFKKKLIPAKDWKILGPKLKNLIRTGGVDPKRVEYHENITRHDVIAFTTAVAEKVGPTSRYVHFGLTSSDVVDTAFSLMIVRAGKIILADIETLIKTLKKRAKELKSLPTIGRSHGISAEPTSFGLKLLGWYEEWKRNAGRLEAALENIRFGKLSGAVGVNAHWSPAFEEKILKRLKLEREPVSTQVIPRDRHAELLCIMAIAGSSMERIAVELRHLQRSEVGEAMEGFRKGQKGSSAMPHKRNPISTENLTGCARLLRSYAQAGLENVALWHERDISHSSVERVAFPDAFILFDYALNRLNGVLSNWVVRKGNVQKNLDRAGPMVFSGHYLLELVKAGAKREDAYYWVQECALKVMDNETPELKKFKNGDWNDFQEHLSIHPKIKKFLTKKQIAKLGSIDYQLRHVDQIFDRSI